MPRIRERHIPELKAFPNWPRYRQSIRLRPHGWFHRKEVQQVGDEERLIRDCRKGGKYRLYVCARSRDRSRQKIKGANRQRTRNRLINHERVAAVITKGS